MQDIEQARGAPRSVARLCGIAALGAAMHGVLLCIAFPPFSVSLAVPFAVAPLVIVAYALAGRDGSARPSRGARWLAIAIVWMVSMAPWLWFERWMGEVSDAGWPAMSAMMAVWAALFTALLGRGLARWRPRPAIAALVAAVLWTGIECFRAHIYFDGYPWYLLAHPLIDMVWIAQSAEWWGLAPLTFVAAFSGAVLGLAVVGRRSRLSWTAALAAWVALTIAGAVRLSTLEFTPGPVVLAIQTNVPSSNKVRWSFEQQVKDFARFIDLTIEGIVDARRRNLAPALVAWPETMLPGFGLEPDTISLQRAMRVPPADLFSSEIEKIVRSSGIPMLVGSNAFEGLREVDQRWEWNRRFNSSYLVRGEPPYRRYDKLQLTPFGETMPYIRASKRLQQALLDLGAREFTFDLDEGTEAVVFDLDDGTRVVTPICFENTVPAVVRRLVDGPDGKRADLVINLSNDGWFGASDDGRATHEMAARWRAIEFRVGMVRVVNTGITSLIDPAGRVLERLPPRTDGWLMAQTRLAGVRTIYARAGDVGSWLAMISALLLVGSTFVTRRRSVVSTALAVGLALVTPALVVGCESPAAKPSGRPSTPPTVAPGTTSAAGSQLGLDVPPSRQAWSTREQSVSPDQERASTGDRPAQPLAPGIPVKSSGSLRQTSIDLLQTAARSGYPILAANAIEALTIDPAALRPVVRPALVDPNRGVRFVAAMGVGKAKLTDTATLIQPLLMDPSDSVRAAAIFALVRIGQPVDQSPLGEMIRSDDPEVRGNAIMILGDLGNPSAIPMLRATIGMGMTRVDPARRRITDLQLAEALAKLGEDAELEPIRAALFSPSQQAELIALATQIVARVRDGGSISSLQAVAFAGGDATRPPEIRLLAFIALAELGTGDPSICGEFARRYLNDPNPQLRGLAVRALAGCERANSLSAIESRLYDTNPEVQIAAASAILRLSVEGQLPSGR